MGLPPVSLQALASFFFFFFFFFFLIRFGIVLALFCLSHAPSLPSFSLSISNPLLTRASLLLTFATAAGVTQGHLDCHWRCLGVRLYA